MKKMFFVVALFCATLFSSCGDDYDDSALWNGLNSLEARVAKLEELCKQMNTNISSLQTLVAALQSNDYVTGITPVTKSGETIGYTITFSKSNPITIYHGEDGKDGTNGKDGHTPVVGVKKHTDGVYYWTLDGNWLLDTTGNKIKASGADGANGKDGITPQLKIENEYWYVSYDNGKTWEEVGKATGEDGENGASGDSMFASIDNTTSAEYVIFTLSDGTQIKLPTWSAFEALRTQCNQMNTNIESLRALINVLESHDYIQSVTPLMEDGTQVGYTINFAYSNPITIYSNASSSSAPIIGVKKDADNVYYWTLDGEWLLDDDGNKIKAEAKDGADGNEGVTPKLKIEDGYWYVSYDNGTSWTKLGKATGADGANANDIKITQDDNNVYFELADGTVVTIPKSEIDSNIIQFEDVYTKAMCVRYGDLDGDGEISYEEAKRYTGYISFTDNPYITAFDELKYFSMQYISCTNCKNLYKISLSESMTEIKSSAFEYCTSLSIVNIPNTITTIGERAFLGCTYLRNCTIPSSVTTIGSQAFCNCDNLKEIVIPEGVTTIESSTFSDCDAIAEITIPENVTSVGDNAFGGCDNLRIIYCKPTTPPTLSGNKEPFGYPSSTTVGIIYVPMESVDTYKSKIGWKDYANKITGYDFE